MHIRISLSLLSCRETREGKRAKVLRKMKKGLGGTERGGLERKGGFKETGMRDGARGPRTEGGF